MNPPPLDIEKLKRKEVAALFGVKPATVGDWVKRYGLKQNKDLTDGLATYNLYEVIAWREDFLKGKSKQADGTVDTSVADQKREKALLTRAQREKAEIELAQIKGDVVSKEDSDRAMADVILKAREFLLNLPVRISALVCPDNPGPAKAVIQKEIRYVLETMARGAEDAKKKRGRKVARRRG